jgi:hypothetical protein
MTTPRARPSDELASSQPRIRGSVIRASKQWIRDTYGDGLYRRALERLATEERETVDNQILASSLYPVAAWDHFLENVRNEVQTETGESAEVFDRRNVRESGSQVIRTAYGFLLGFFEPTALISKIGIVFERILGDSHLEVLDNAPGSCHLRLTAPLALRENARHHIRLGLEFLIELTKAQDVNVRVERDDALGDAFVMDLVATYAQRDRLPKD